MSIHTYTLASVGTRTKGSSELHCDSVVRELSREVFGVFGIPVDNVGVGSTISKIESAAVRGSPFFLSTANLNFLILSQTNAEFREALLASDLCTADGMPVVWLANTLGAPIKSRISGSDLFDVLKSCRKERPIKVFLFGGADGLAQSVANKINTQSRGMKCVGAISPGFGSVEELSTTGIIDAINRSGADFVVAFLSAAKGQRWLLQNHNRLTIPVRADFGATINFQAGTVRRAPQVVQKMGMEWLWRIKEEPFLYRRYLQDGLALLSLVVFRAVPLIFMSAFRVLCGKTDFAIMSSSSRGDSKIQISGDAVSDHVRFAIPEFAKCITLKRNVVVDMTRVRFMDARFFGLLLMVRKALRSQDNKLVFVEVNPRIRSVFRLNGFEFLLHGG